MKLAEPGDGVNSPARIDPRALRSRAALRKALADLLAELPMERIAILTLTTRAGVGYATFFRNYSDIEAVLADMSDVLIDELTNLIAPLAHYENDMVIARAIARFVDERRILLKPLFVGASATLQRAIVARATKRVSGRENRCDPALPVELAIRHSVEAVTGILNWWLEQDCARSVEDVAILIERLALRPIAPPRDG